MAVKSLTNCSAVDPRRHALHEALADFRQRLARVELSCQTNAAEAAEGVDVALRAEILNGLDAGDQTHLSSTNSQRSPHFQQKKRINYINDDSVSDSSLTLQCFIIYRSFLTESIRICGLEESGGLLKMMSTKYRPPSFRQIGASRTTPLITKIQINKGSNKHVQCWSWCNGNSIV